MRHVSHRTAILEERAAQMRHAPTGPEARLFEALRGRRLGVSFRRQVPLAGRFIADLYCAELRLVVEVDGGYHADRAEADERRDRALRKLGYHVLRIPNALVLEALPSAVERVRDAVAGLGGPVRT